MTSTNGSAIARAIAELESERQNLTARIGKLDEAVATLRALFHLPTERTPKAPSANGNGHRKSDLTKDAIRAALAHGPLSPGALATAVGMPVARTKYHVAQLVEDGELVASGTTAARRIALAGSSAKEVP